MIRASLLLSLFILGVSGASFLKRPKTTKLKANTTTVTKTSVTQKFKLFKQDGEWKSTCDIRGLALGGWFVPEKFINIQDYATPDMPSGKAKADAEGSIYE